MNSDSINNHSPNNDKSTYTASSSSKSSTGLTAMNDINTTGFQESMMGRLVTMEKLWCECQGDHTAVPHSVATMQQMMRLHDQAERHAIYYVSVVLALYVVGLVIIIRRSGRSERHTAASALSFCFSRAASTVASRRQRQRRRGSERQENQIVVTPPSSEPHQHQAIVVPSLQVHLVVPDEDDEMEEISMVTTVA